MLGAIGNTPVVRLVHLIEPGMAEVWVKLEAANPTGSYKDRMALAMIEAAERAGRLAPGQPVVEYTGGSTGSSLAFVCAVTGHPLHIVTSDAFAEEKRRTMEAFGALVEVLPSPEGVTPAAHPAHAARAREVATELGAYQTDQFTTPTWSRATGAWARSSSSSFPAAIDALCAYVGTAGCFLGVSGRAAGSLPRPAAGGRRAGRVGRALGRVARHAPHRGWRHRGAPRPARLDDIDDVIAVSTADAFAMARRAARVEGLFSGPSTGANLTAALDVARRLGEGRRVVTLQVDSGLKYLAGAVYVDAG